MKNSRETALSALVSWRTKGIYPDVFLREKLKDASAQDAALTSIITYGVIQNKMLLDYYLSQVSKKPLSSVTPIILDALRIGAFQLLLMDGIAEYAAVNESVNMIKRRGNTAGGSFVNGILRNIARTKGQLQKPPKTDMAEYLSIMYSHEKWLVQEFMNLEDCEALLQANNAPSNVCLRINTLKSADVLKQLDEEKKAYIKPEYPDNCISVPTVAGLSDYLKKGLLYVQDMASQMCVHVLNPEPGDYLLDMCAAPGGKSLLAAQLMNNKGRILSLDVSPGKVDELTKQAAVYGANIMECAVWDGTKKLPDRDERPNKVLCDVPCSGSGIIRKKPDIKYKKKDVLDILPDIQYKILNNGAIALAPGGVLVYSTCSIIPGENEDVVNRFLSEHEDFALDGFSLKDKYYEGMCTLYPHIDGTDGFFITRMRKNETKS